MRRSFARWFVRLHCGFVCLGFVLSCCIELAGGAFGEEKKARRPNPKPDTKMLSMPYETKLLGSVLKWCQFKETTLLLTRATFMRHLTSDNKRL